ncbi:MAG: GNAT family N-acetyltransferase [Gammaproteobacteria bacterium]|nr:GNAT family N-acetyltransferase [Gammaproteobacteria bacterium]MDH3411292.1 GNAT family N-acetyltransferase [Gammaproteobacteria bacterium]
MRRSIFGNRRQSLDYRDRERTPPRALSCRIIPYSNKHKTLVAELQRHLWSPDARLNASYLEWKYHQNPYIRDPLIYLAFVGDQLVGMRGAFGTRWEVGDPTEFFTLPYADDLVIDPAYRRQGLHRVIMNFALRDLAARGYRFVVNLSASRITFEASMNMRWRNAGRVRSLYHRTIRKTTAEFLANRVRRLPLLWRWADNLSALSGRSGDHLFDRLDARFSALDQWRDSRSLFAQKTPLTREMAQLVARLPRDGRIRHVRDEAFFAWRFGNPLHNYRFFYGGREQLRGYLVLQQTPSVSGDRACIVDWEAESELMRAELLSAAIGYGKFPEMCIWQLGVSPSTARVLERHKFKSLVAPHEHSVLVRSVRDDELNAPWILGGRRLDDANQWDLRMIYSMLG